MKLFELVELLDMSLVTFYNKVYTLYYLDYLNWSYYLIVSVQIESNGNVVYTRLFRMRAAFDANINQYPYDTQMPVIQIASTDYSNRKVQVYVILKIKGWPNTNPKTNESK